MSGAEGRIRWETGAFGNQLGYAGNLYPWIFQIYQPRNPPWALMTSLPGMDRVLARGDDPEELKAEAEKALESYVAAPGASFGEAAS